MAEIWPAKPSPLISSIAEPSEIVMPVVPSPMKAPTCEAATRIVFASSAVFRTPSTPALRTTSKLKSPCSVRVSRTVIVRFVASTRNEAAGMSPWSLVVVLMRTLTPKLVAKPGSVAATLPLTLP